MRGEEGGIRLDGLLSWEIPPRARGRADFRVVREADRGNTPACAGKSTTSSCIKTRTRKYPRVRGEEWMIQARCVASMEIPPRARGRDDPAKRRTLYAGNTPACAGKSAAYCTAYAANRKYPRVRGEEIPPRCHEIRPTEIPPRARGRAPCFWHRQTPAGNTPACAGKRCSC